MSVKKLGWIIDSYLIDNEIIPKVVPSLFIEQGHTVVIATLGRFSESLSVDINDNVHLWSALGSINFIKRITKLSTFRNKNIHPFFMCECHSYMQYQHMIPRDLMLNTNGIVLPLSECMNHSPKSLMELTGSTALHVRPDNGLKVAEAQQIELTSSSDWGTWISDTLRFSSASSNTLFWLFKRKSIDAEYRLVIFNGKVIASSPYPHDFNHLNRMDPAVPDKAIDVANNAAKSIKVSDPIYVLDIVRIKDSFFVLELNCMATSGWYSLPPTTIVNYLSLSLNNIALDMYSDVLFASST